jgi:nucleotidyltransferase/DNA polymerase involved in DNA repair
MEDWRARRDAYVSVRHPLEVSGGPPKRQRAVQLSQGEDPVVPHSPTCIVHVDIDCFYAQVSCTECMRSRPHGCVARVAQVEMVREPSLRGKPIGIQQKYLLVTCNYEARKFGVTKLQSLADARRKCPHITILNGSTLTHYREASENIHRCKIPPSPSPSPSLNKALIHTLTLPLSLDTSDRSHRSCASSAWTKPSST